MREIVVDLALAAFALAGAGLLYYGSSGLPPPRFEPMGSAAVPRILASLLVLFAIILSASAVRRYFGGINTRASEHSSASSVSNFNTESSSDTAVPADTAAASTTSGSAVRAIIFVCSTCGICPLRWTECSGRSYLSLPRLLLSQAHCYHDRRFAR